MAPDSHDGAAGGTPKARSGHWALDQIPQWPYVPQPQPNPSPITTSDRVNIRALDRGDCFIGGEDETSAVSGRLRNPQEGSPDMSLKSEQPNTSLTVNVENLR
ncbi:hypothetical protein J6590_027690 [Homalodisca vitripennis]|nr:hypothetical protein J6590_027690 [Homalodisca vitripennis]